MRRVVGFLDLVQGVVGELVRKWEELFEEQQWEIAKELIPDIEQVMVLTRLRPCEPALPNNRRGMFC